LNDEELQELLKEALDKILESQGDESLLESVFEDLAVNWTARS
jgi:hypothetical protein